jgi:hypothetical protein
VRGDQLDSYITIDADGSVVAYYGKIDGGQGLVTAIAQMVAEEINVAYERVRVVMGDSELTLDMGGASAANGVSHGGMMLRRTAAEARHLLVEMAANSLGQRANELAVTDGVVHAVANPAKRVSYAELIGGRYFDSKVTWNGKTSSALAVETKVSLTKPADFKVIGQSFPRRDLPGKVFGTLEMVNEGSSLNPSRRLARVIERGLDCCIAYVAYWPGAAKLAKPAKGPGHWGGPAIPAEHAARPPSRPRESRRLIRLMPSHAAAAFH